MFKRIVLLSTVAIFMSLLTATVGFAAQGQITEVNPSGIGIGVAAVHTDVGLPPGISVADGITDVGPPGITVGIEEVFGRTPGGKIASGLNTSPGSSTAN